MPDIIVAHEEFHECDYYITVVLPLLSRLWDRLLEEDSVACPSELSDQDLDAQKDSIIDWIEDEKMKLEREYRGCDTFTSCPGDDMSNWVDTEDEWRAHEIVENPALLEVVSAIRGRAAAQEWTEECR